jgi:hypothetical protein
VCLEHLAQAGRKMLRKKSILGTSEVTLKLLRQEEINKQTKKTPWPLICKRTIPTERPPLVDEI